MLIVAQIYLHDLLLCLDKHYKIMTNKKDKKSFFLIFTETFFPSFFVVLPEIFWKLKLIKQKNLLKTRRGNGPYTFTFFSSLWCVWEGGWRWVKQTKAWLSVISIQKKFHLACQSYLISFPPQFDPPSKYFKDNTAFSISPSSWKSKENYFCYYKFYVDGCEHFF